ncbi:effector binding domain-containing protein [Tissierella sp.]|uniref:effector binding domain-containing protein n=1 Tax=Tissierella sp. TaxID=41274 RepID=UPI002863354E|nr:effector binding domain-containing protein [Tissierella sp.]MDR7855021.1 effector binding domain-containing protein [Tissierella sp.]
MAYVNAMEKALIYIENHLNDDIDLSIIAKEAGYSLYHFHRIFKGVVGDSIKEYIRKRRITEAAKELVSSNKPTIDIAIKYGYQSREAFSRAFEKVYGRNPLEVKHEGLFYHIREPMTFDYMMFEYNRQKYGMQPVLQKLPEFLVVGKKYDIQVDKSSYQEIPLLWQQWNNSREWTYIEERKYDDKCMGICIFEEGDTFQYMVGHEVTSVNNIPKDMTAHRIKPSLYAVFKTIGPLTESVQKTIDYIYTVWLSESEYEHAGLNDIEYYYYSQGELVADIYIPILPSNKSRHHNI